MAKLISFCFLALLLTACARSPRPVVEDLSNTANSPHFTLQSLRGTRDGDRLVTVAMFSDSSAILAVQMVFAVGTPTTLHAGTWQFNRSSQQLTGTVAARNITFLGGQDGPPSIGGTFDLLNESGVAQYRVNLPVTALKSRL
jgi:hypothetical protein